MSPFTQMFLFIALGIGTTVTLTSSHWLLAWMGLEVSTLAIAPLMARKHHPRAIEATTKYFLAQATAAAVLLFASVSNAWLSGQWEISQMTHPLPTSLIILALTLKLGLAPFHGWLPEVLQGLDLTMGLVLSTWQKLAPFALLYQISPSTPALLTTLALLSMMVGGWGGLNQTQLRKILAYSSIAHLGWMALVLQYSPSLTILALAIYLIMTATMFMALKLLDSTSMNKLAISWTKAPLVSLLLPLVLLSLAGLPPLTGFAPKWMILQELSTQGLPVVATIAALTALLSLFFYLRVSYAVVLTISPATTPTIARWRLDSSFPTFFLAALLIGTLSLLPLAPLLLALTST
uniref:NADH-ubiquinone oxidoreductase chain 2 n=1 Tax=Enneapterygius etheostoma TaxID=3354692 RepID=A0A1V1G0Z3_9TELE|nr:NADH dehydrogenase subunit 2 [Enneapterygius etheostomus]